jgi:aryl-alcohol dehydrogenase-like predicted oxidoreductase
VILHAQQKNKGVFIKKALASGHVEKLAAHDPVRAAMNFIFSEPGVSSVIVGTLNQDHLRYNVECAVDALSVRA